MGLTGSREVAATTFLWGLKRSGNHLLANWLYANHGATARDVLDSDGLHPQLHAGFRDVRADVAFFNNCGWLHSRGFGLGDLDRGDFQVAMRRQTTTIFGIEDCDLAFVPKTPHGPGIVNVLLLRDPLNNLASRLEAAKTRPEIFRVDEAYIEVYEMFCAEALGRSHHLVGKTVVNYNHFIDDRAYRDSVAAELGLRNVDVMSEATDFGGGSSFSDAGRPSATSLKTRFRQHRVPDHLVEMLLSREAIRVACETLFGYDLAALSEGA